VRVAGRSTQLASHRNRRRLRGTTEGVGQKAGGSPQADGAPSAPAQEHPPCEARDHTEFIVKQQLLQEGERNGERNDNEHEGEATAEAPWIRPWIPRAQQPVVDADRAHPSQVRGVEELRVETACGVRGWLLLTLAEVRAWRRCSRRATTSPHWVRRRWEGASSRGRWRGS